MSVLGYHSGEGLLYRIDVRFKLSFVIIIGLACIHASPAGLAFISLLLIAALAQLPLRLSSLVASFGWVFIFLLFVFGARALSEPGDPVIVFQGLTVTREGIFQGLLVCWRLMILVISGVLLSVTTRSAEVTAGVAWLLRPVPLIPAQRVATMLGLVVRFLPLVLDQAREISAAQRARGVENRKNPFYRLKVSAIPLLRKSFERADRLSLAMEARCYTETPRDGGLSAGAVDWGALAAVCSVCLAAGVL
jgi:energy-coupling factor transporter transmembrane protein EcfT